MSADSTLSIGWISTGRMGYSMVSAPKDLLQVTVDEGGVLTQTVAPKIFIDYLPVDESASQAVRDIAGKCGTKYLVAPVSDNNEEVFTKYKSPELLMLI